MIKIKLRYISTLVLVILSEDRFCFFNELGKFVTQSCAKCFIVHKHRNGAIHNKNNSNYLIEVSYL